MFNMDMDVDYTWMADLGYNISPHHHCMFNMYNGYGCGLDLDGWFGVQHICFAIHLSQNIIIYKKKYHNG